jgi:hypothetical protein
MLPQSHDWGTQNRWSISATHRDVNGIILDENDTATLSTSVVGNPDRCPEGRRLVGEVCSTQPKTCGRFVEEQDFAAHEQQLGEADRRAFLLFLDFDGWQLCLHVSRAGIMNALAKGLEHKVAHVIVIKYCVQVVHSERLLFDCHLNRLQRPDYCR